MLFFEPLDFVLQKSDLLLVLVLQRFSLTHSILHAFCKPLLKLRFIILYHCNFLLTHFQLDHQSLILLLESLYLVPVFFIRLCEVVFFHFKLLLCESQLFRELPILVAEAVLVGAADLLEALDEQPLALAEED